GRDLDDLRAHRRGAGLLPGAILREGDVTRLELLPGRGLRVLDHGVRRVAVLEPRGPQREGGNGLRGVKVGQVRARAPEPGQELEAALLGVDAGERDAGLAD